MERQDKKVLCRSALTVTDRPYQMGPDWTRLPPELIQFISEKIPFMDVYHRFRAVCPAWRRNSSPHPRHISSLPWLFLPQPQEQRSVYSFYDFSQSKSHQVNRPGDTYGFPISSSRSWFVLKRGNELSLMNVVTGEMKDGLFPSLDSPPTILGFAFNRKTKQPSNETGTIGLGTKYHVSKVVLTSSPSDENCCIVASFSGCDSQWELAFCNVRDRCWTVLRLPESGRGDRHLEDFMYQNGLIYAIDDHCHISVYGLRDLSRKIMRSNLDLIQSAGNSIYLVTGETKQDGRPLIVRRLDPVGEECEVYKCYEHGQKYTKKRVTNIGNNVLLLDAHRCLIVPCGDDIKSHGWKPNHIYQFFKNGNSEFYNITLKTFNIRNSSVQEVQYGSTGVLYTKYRDRTWSMAHLY